MTLGLRNEEAKTNQIKLSPIKVFAFTTSIVMVLAAIFMELATERIYHPSVIPADGFLYTLLVYGTQLLVILSLFTWVILNFKVQNKGVSQFWVWMPYTTVWVVLALFLISPGDLRTNYWISLIIIILGVAIGPALGADQVLANLVAKTCTRFVIVISLVAVFMFTSRAFIPYEIWPGGWWQDVDRFQGILPHPNVMGWVAALAVIIELRRKFSETNFFFIVLALIALVLSGSRTATVSLIFALVAWFSMLLWIKLSKGRLIVLALAFVVAFCTYLLILGTGLDADALNNRTRTWSNAIQAFSKNQLTGVGPGKDFAPGSQYAHNQVLQTMAEMGLLGLSALLVSIVAMIHIFLRSENKPLSAALTVFWLVTFVTENYLRIASLNFIVSLTLFQLCLYSVGKSVTKDSVIRND